MANPKVQVEITGDASSVLGVFDRVTGGIKGLTSNAEGMLGNIGKSVSNLIAPVTALVGVLGGGAMFKTAIDETVALGKETAKIQRVMGGTREEAAAYRMAIGDIHGDLDTFLGGIQKLVKGMNSNEDGLKRMGIATRDAQGNLLPMQEIIQNTNQALQKFSEGADRDAAAQSAVGKSWADWLLFLKLTPGALDEARKKSEALNMTMGPDAAKRVSAYRDAMNETGDVLEALKVNVGLELLPHLTNLGNWFAAHGPAVIGPTVKLLELIISALSSTSVQIGLVLIGLQKFGPGLWSWASNLGSAISQVAGRLVGLQGPLSATASSLMGLINPWTAAAAAAVAAGLALEWFARAEERAREAWKKSSDAYLKGVRDWGQASAEAVRLEEEAQRARAGSTERARLQERLQISTGKLLQMYPSLAQYLRDEHGKVRSLAEALKLANDERERAVRLEAANAEAGERAIERMIAQRKQWIEYGESEKQRNVRLGATAEWEGYTDKIAYQKKQLAIDEEMLARQKRITQERREALDLLRASNAVESGGGKRWHGNDAPKAKVESTLAEEMRRILEGRLKDEKALTLEAQERNEIQLAEIELAKALDGLEAKRTKEHWTDSQFLEAAAAEKERAEKKIQIEIPAKYAALAEQEREKVQKVEAEQAKAHAEALMRLEDDRLQQLYESGRITALELITLETATEEKRYQVARDGLWDRLQLERLSAEERARVHSELERLEDQHNQRMQQLRHRGQAEQERGSLRSGGMAYVVQAKRELMDWRGTAMNVMQGVESSFASGIQGILQGNLSLSKGLKTIWKGIASTIAGALAQIAAKFLTMAVANAVFKTSQAEATAAATGAALLQAAAETWAAYAWIPWVGPALAAAQIAVMNASMLAQAGVAKGITATAFAEGGLVDRPTFGLLGEAGQRELAVPEITFTNWADNLTANLLAEERRDRDHQLRSARSASQARPDRDGGITLGPGALAGMLQGAQILDTSRRGLETLGSHILDAIEVAAARRGAVLQVAR